MASGPPLITAEVLAVHSEGYRYGMGSRSSGHPASEDLQALQSWAVPGAERSLGQEQAPVFKFKSPHPVAPLSSCSAVRRLKRTHRILRPLECSFKSPPTSLGSVGGVR